jgi:mycoredoxin-dependent peroxiredoxin
LEWRAARRTEGGSREGSLTEVLEVGDVAPDFSLRDQHGQQQTLGARRGERNVLLVFYPFAFTGVCTGEMRALSDNASAWVDLGTDVLAVSCDSVPSLRVFAEQEELEFPLVSDFWPHGEVSTAYGAFDSKLGAAGRATYAIDKAGAVRWTVRTAIPDARDINDYLKALAGL